MHQSVGQDSSHVFTTPVWDPDTLQNVTVSDNDTFTNKSKDGYSVDKQVMAIYQILVPTLFLGIILFGLLGNLLVVYVIISQRKLWTISNLLLLNLAATDVLFLLICGGFSAAYYMLTEWPLGNGWCLLMQYLMYVSCYVTVYTLVAVSIVRYIYVVHGPRHITMRTRKTSAICVIVIWVTFLLLKIPILFVHGVSHDPLTGRTDCIIDGNQEGQELFTCFFVFAYILPLGIIATLYLMIVRYLKSPNRRVPSIHTPRVSRQGHVTKVLTILVCTFAICWLPLHIHLLWAYHGSIPNSIVYKVMLIVWHCLIYVNSMLNPLIYNFFSKDFKDSFRKVFQCKKEPIVV